MHHRRSASGAGWPFNSRIGPRGSLPSRGNPATPQGPSRLRLSRSCRVGRAHCCAQPARRTGYVEIHITGSEGGLGKRNACKGVKAPQPDPTQSTLSTTAVSGGSR